LTSANPAPGHRLKRGHVDAVDVRTLFTIDFLWRQRCRSSELRWSRSRTLRAPSHGTNSTLNSRSKERSVCPRGGLSERPPHPTVPIHRIVRVLQEIGALLLDESVGGLPESEMLITRFHRNSIGSSSPNTHFQRPILCC